MQWMIGYRPLDYIIDGLYLGNINAASDSKMLEKFGITHILRVLKGDFGKIHYDKFTYKVIQIDDIPDANIQKYFEPAHKFIEEALAKNKKILVHWQVGMSRSATIVLSYLMKKYPEMTLNKALRFVKSKRPIVNPNEGFIKQLKNYERYLEKERAKMKYSEKLENAKQEENEGQQNQKIYANFEPPIRREKNIAKELQSRNYHYNAIAKDPYVDVITQDKTQDANYENKENVYELRKKLYSSKVPEKINNAQNFLEQNLYYHKPSVLAKNGIHVTNNLLNPYGMPVQTRNDRKTLDEGTLKKQHFISPVSSNKGDLLQAEYDKAKAMNRIPSYAQYFSPQRDSSKIKQLRDFADRKWSLAQAPTYKVRQNAYTSGPRRDHPIGFNYFVGSKTSHKMLPTSSYPDLDDRRYRYKAY